jgi:guanylate kinase
MSKGRIIILSGPSGAGKTTLYKKLLRDKSFKGSLVRSISLTTRPKRPGEIHGRDYFFVSIKKFLYKQRAGHLLEYQKVFRDYYGTPYKPVRAYLHEGKSVLLCIDVKGAAIVKAKVPDSLGIFIAPPNLAVLKERLVKRGTESKAELEVRLQRAGKELSQAKRYNYVFVNADLRRCYRDLRKAILRELFPHKDDIKSLLTI